MCYILEHDVISDFQFGFMPNRSTSDAVYQLCQNLYESKNRGEVIAVAFLDLKKAFDTVNHILSIK